MPLARSVSGCLFAATLSVFAIEGVAADAVPARVVSMNVCTDQLAMLVADEDQLYSVTYMASDPSTSVMTDEARRYRVNHGFAEEIFLMQPDLVVAGAYTTPTTVDMLRRLGFRVEQFAPENSFDDIRENLRKMGRLLGREERAESLVAALDRGLADLRDSSVADTTVATYSIDSFTAGAGTLADTVIEAAGLKNLARELGLRGISRLPLEVLLLADPDLVVNDRPRSAPALAQQNFTHPAFEAFGVGDRLVFIPDAYWVCGGPFTLEAARILQERARSRAAGLPQAASNE